MPIVVELDKVMRLRKMSLDELSKRVGVTNVNLSRIKTGKARAIRLSTLEPICSALECQPGDILKYRPDEEPAALRSSDLQSSKSPGANEPPPPRSRDGGS